MHQCSNDSPARPRRSKVPLLFQDNGLEVLDGAEVVEVAEVAGDPGLRLVNPNKGGHLFMIA